MTESYGRTPSAVTRACTVRTSSRSAAADAVYASRRARMATSTAGRTRSAGRSSRRVSSRRRRLSRLRSTAECWCRGTTIPMRGRPRGEARTRTSRCAVRIRFPSRMTACMSDPRVSLFRRGKPKPSLCAGVFARELNGEAPPSLLPAAAEDLTSPLRFHARTKPVGFDAALVPGTVCRLTHGATPKTVENSL